MRYLIISLFFIFYYLLGASPAWAAQNKFITIVNPIRGGDFWTLLDSQPLDNVKAEWQLILENNLDATWVIRPDGLEDPSIVELLRTFPPSQELGLFMEITPTWAKMAGVKYHQDANWHNAGSVFLTGYSVLERHKLIDSAFEKFKKTFGQHPKSVGSWWIDAGSLQYMKDRYGVVANMDVADQFTTDNYQVWGQYFSSPFYPSLRNAMLPASDEGKIGVLTLQWAARDPFNAYGNGVLDSTYSVQANDYANPKYHSLTTDYFKKLLSVYLDSPYSNVGQVTIGLENDFLWQNFGEEFRRQIRAVVERKIQGTQVVTMSEFSQRYTRLYPGTTPAQIIFADDPLGSGGKVLWYQNTKYRVGWFYSADGSLIRDLRLYQSLDEPCLLKACSNLNLGMSESKNLDEVTYGDRWILDEGKIKDVSLRKLVQGVEINYTNQAGNKRTITFLPDDIKVNNSSFPIPVAIAQAIDASKNIKKIEGNFSYGLKDGLVSVLIGQLKNLAIFLIFIYLAFYLPGMAILRRSQFFDQEKFILSWPVGLASFTLAAFIFGMVHFYWGLFILPILSLVYLKKDIFKLRPGRFSLWTTIIILLGSLSWLLTTVKNGLLYDFGLGFWGAHGHDAIWHLSLIESVKSGLPLENFSFAGEKLLNYHFFFDLLLGATSVLTKIGSSDLYFRMFPIFVSISVGLAGFCLAKSWFRSTLAVNLALFFLYFGGSFGWLVSFFKERSLGGETLFWAQQGISTLINPPFAVSVWLFLGGLILFHKLIYQKQHHIGLFIPLVILWGSLIEFKAYGGLLVLGGLFFATVYEIVKGNLSFLKISLPVALLSLVIFLPNNLGSSSLLVFQPFWLIHSMVDSADRLNWIRLSNARILGLDSGNYFKFLTAEVVGFLIFVLGNLGTRAVGFLAIFRYAFSSKVNSWDSFKIFIGSFLILSISLPLIFIQKGGSFNIVQFFYYFILVFNFLVAASLANLIKNFKFGRILIGLVILLTLPTTWDSLHHFIPKRPPSMIPSGEVEGLKFLKNQPDGRVLSYYFDKKNHEKYGAPQPLFAYQSTPYVSAFSEKREFIADTVNLEITGVDYKGRLQIQKDIFAMREPEMVKKELRENNIKYIYTPKAANFNPNPELFGVKKVFENDDVSIFEVP